MSLRIYLYICIYTIHKGADAEDVTLVESIHIRCNVCMFCILKNKNKNVLSFLKTLTLTLWFFSTLPTFWPLSPPNTVIVPTQIVIADPFRPHTVKMLLLVLHTIIGNPHSNRAPFVPPNTINAPFMPPFVHAHSRNVPICAQYSSNILL